MHLARLSLMATNLQPIIIMEPNLMCSNEKDFNSFRFDNINSPQLAGATDLLIQTDIGLGQILYALTKDKFNTHQIWMTASAFRIPLQDSSVDATVCIRLSHHIVTAKQRESLLVELLRVSQRFVIMTYFDYHSIKNKLRRVRKKKSKLTMTKSQISELAAAHGAELVANPPLSLIGSGHRYALVVKNHN